MPVVSFIVIVGNPITGTKSVFDLSEIVKADIPGALTGVAATGGLGRARTIVPLSPGVGGL